MKKCIAIRDTNSQKNIESIEEYGEKVNAKTLKFHSIDDIPHKCGDYDRILIFYGNMYVSPQAENIFAMFRSGICMVEEPNEHKNVVKRITEESIPTYFNIDVILCSKEHLPAFTAMNKNYELWEDLDNSNRVFHALNYYLHACNDLMISLCFHWNFNKKIGKKFEKTKDDGYFIKSEKK